MLAQRGIVVLTKRKVIFGILLLAVIAAIAGLTFQDAAGSVRLSESVRGILEGIGIHTDFHGIRSNAHLVLYFAFGLVLCLFCREIGLKWWITLLIGFGFGLLDESVKILLPTRGFEAADLLRDWVGIVCAYGLTKVGKIWRRNDGKNG